MKLTYRGIAYEISAPVQSDAANQFQDQSKTKLIYRGQTYYATPREAVAAVELGPMVTLCYRGRVYGRQAPTANPCYRSQSINWRYRAAQ